MENVDNEYISWASILEQGYANVQFEGVKDGLFVALRDPYTYSVNRKSYLQFKMDIAKKRCDLFATKIQSKESNFLSFYFRVQFENNHYFVLTIDLSHLKSEHIMDISFIDNRIGKSEELAQIIRLCLVYMVSDPSVRLYLATISPKLTFNNNNVRHFFETWILKEGGTFDVN